MKNNVNEFSWKDCGAFGKAMECALTKKNYVKAQNKADYISKRLDGKKISYEIKTGAGKLSMNSHHELAHCRYVIYVPVVQFDEEGTVNAEMQEGFIVEKTAFVEMLNEIGLLRTDKDYGNGQRGYAIQTFWNCSKNAPTSKKAYARLLNALYDTCEMTLKEFLEK